MCCFDAIELWSSIISAFTVKGDFVVSTFDNLNQSAKLLAWEPTCALQCFILHDLNALIGVMSFLLTAQPPQPPPPHKSNKSEKIKSHHRNIKHSGVTFLWRVTHSGTTVTLITCQERSSQPANGNKDDRASSHTASWSMGGREVGKNKKAVLTCSHWVRYCHSDKSHYDSPFLLTCRGGRNRAVSPNNQRLQQVAESNTDGPLQTVFPGGGGGGCSVASAGVCVVEALLFNSDQMKCLTPTRCPVLNNTLRCTFCSCKALYILYKLAYVAS